MFSISLIGNVLIVHCTCIAVVEWQDYEKDFPQRKNITKGIFPMYRTFFKSYLVFVLFRPSAEKIDMINRT